MARTIRTVLSNFSAGELNPLLKTRTDAKAYFNGAQTLRNWYMMDSGGLMRRQGTTYKATLAGESRILPFIFSDDEIAIFVLSNNRLDVFNSAGVSVQSNYTTNCNWTTAQLFELNIAQFGDTVFIAHRNNPIVKIKRTSATAFTGSLFAFDSHSSGYPRYKPYYKYADSGVTLTPAATSGSTVNITASSAIFDTDDNWVGKTIRIGQKEIDIASRTNTTVVVGNIRETLANTNATAEWDEQLISSHRGFPQAITFHDNRLWLGGVKSKPSSVNSSHVGDYFNFSVGTGLANEGIDVAIGGDQVNEIRHLYSGSNLQIYTDGGEYIIPTSSDTSAITPSNIVFRRQTPYGCSRTRPISFDGATLYSQKNGRAVREFIYSDSEAGYTSTNISVLASHLIDTPKDIAMISGSSTRPEQFAIFTNSGSTHNGKLAVFHSIRDEDIAGWTLWSTRTGDTFHSVTSANENLFAVCKRTLNSSVVYTLEKFAEDDSLSLDCSTTSTLSQRGTPLVKGASQSGLTLIMDGLTTSPQIQEEFTIAGVTGTYRITAVTNNGSNTYTVTLNTALASSPADNASITLTKGFLHTVNGIYTNESVNAVNGNSSLGAFTVSGSDTLTFVVDPQPTGVSVGFNYTPELETMPIDVETDSGPLTGLPRRIVRCIIDVADTLDVSLKSPNTASAHELVILQSGFTVGSDLAKQNGKKEFYFLGYSKSPTVTVTQNDPLPLKVLGMALEVQFN
jgi:hypothetical protein|tara:strand:+ start:1635 stop:3842 length:2208 start_codon:yes stop_codon:yes gene_type:complete